MSSGMSLQLSAIHLAIGKSFPPYFGDLTTTKKTKNEALVEEEEIEKEESAAFTHEKNLERGNLKIKNFSFLAKMKQNVRKKSCVV